MSFDGVPIWKIRREARRLRLQISSLVSTPVELLERRLYDQTRLDKIRRTPGLRPAQDCIAIYLIYQPDGVLPSTLLTCQFLNRNGFAVHAVSNAPLSDADREALAADCTLILERPNFGYDFGGYRDGILDVLEGGKLPERLLVMNDSVWFPLFEDTDLLDRLRDTPFDIFGPATKRYPGKPHKDHICSFMFSFSNRLLKSDGFSRYWRTLRMSNDKRTVIRRNEIKMTYKLSRLGFTAGWMHDFDDVVAITRTMSLAELQAFVEQQAASTELTSMQAEARELLDLRRSIGDDAKWAAAVQDRVEGLRMGKHIVAVHPAISVRQLRMPVFKKDRSPHFKHLRQTLKALPEFQQVPAIIRAEITGWDRD